LPAMMPHDGIIVQCFSSNWRN